MSGTATTSDAQTLEDRAPSVGEMLRRRVRQSPDDLAFQYPDANDAWQPLTWRQTAELAYDLAAALLKCGLKREDRVGIAATTRIEWIVADFAIMCAGGATTTVYPTTKPDDVAFIIDDSGARFAFLEDQEQLAKLKEHEALFAGFKAVVLIDGSAADEQVYSWDEFLAMGREHRAENPELIDETIDGSRPEHLATLIYTSGTTGRPKGVRLLHDAWAYEGRAVRALGLLTDEDSHYLWLPLSHVFGKALLAVQLECGFPTAVDGRIERIVDGLGEVRPTVMCGAPRIFEKVRNKVMMTSNSGIKKHIAAWAFNVGEKTIDQRLAGKPLTGITKVKYALAEKLVFSKLQNRLGGRIRFLVSGSAKLNADVQRWFYAANLLIIEGYGMTETSAITFVNDYRKPRLGTVGPVLVGSQTKLADDGEILVKGPGVMQGYHQRPDLDEEVFTDGWFHTGDIGRLDAEGNLTITDRKKDLLKTSGGKYVAPQKVEGALVAACPYFAQVVVYGEGHKFITALVTLDPEAITSWAADQDDDALKNLDAEALAGHPKVKAMLQEHVDAANEKLERWETVKRFTVLPRELSVESGEVTPSLKIRRRSVEAAHRAAIEEMYHDE